jgi:hypothetical protein
MLRGARFLFPFGMLAMTGCSDGAHSQQGVLPDTYVVESVESNGCTKLHVSDNSGSRLTYGCDPSDFVSTELDEQGVLAAGIILRLSVRAVFVTFDGEFAQATVLKTKQILLPLASPVSNPAVFSFSEGLAELDAATPYLEVELQPVGGGPVKVVKISKVGPI